MIQFYNGKKADDYATLVDSEVTLESIDNTTESKGVNTSRQRMDRTQYKTWKAILIRRTMAVLLLLTFCTVITVLIYRLLIQKNEISSLKKLLSTEYKPIKWLNGSTGSTVCDFAISDARILKEGHEGSHIVVGQKGRGCPEVCRHMQEMDPLINGVTVFVNETKEGCWCHRNMSAVPSRYNSCFLESNSTSVQKYEDEAEYTCKLTPGYGMGGADVNLGGLKGNVCVNACLHLKKIDNTVNGVTISSRTCWCERGMRYRRFSSYMSACLFVPRHKTTDNDRSRDDLCKLSIGYSNGGASMGMGMRGEGQCVEDCLHMKRIVPSINGVSMHQKQGQCYCQKGMTNITARFKTCFLNSTGTPVCAFTNGQGVSRRHHKISNVKGSACIDACLQRQHTDPSINGVTVSSDVTKGGCVCHRNMTAIDGVYKVCFFNPNVTQPATDFGDTRPACEFEMGDGNGARESYLGLLKGDACINACLHLKQIDDTVNGVTVNANSSRTGCWCESGMRSRFKCSKCTYKSCIFKYNVSQEKTRDSHAMSLCKFSNGYGVADSARSVTLRKQNKVYCIEVCSHLRRVDQSINGITYDEATNTCYCKRKMKIIGRYKTCFLRS